MSKLTDALKSLGACEEAVEWSKGRTFKAAWEECERADWLLWAAGMVGVHRPTLVRAACACARTSLKYVPEGEDRPRLAIGAAERWCDGKATIDEVRAAAEEAAAWAAAKAAAAAAAADKRMAKLVRKHISYRQVLAAYKLTAG